MRPLDFPIEPGDGPRFLAIARAVSDAITSGRLKPGDALPGSRELARAAGVNRNTVLAALNELRLEGWIQTEAAKGTFVSTELPVSKPRGEAKPRRDDAKPAFDLRGDEPSAAGQNLYAGFSPKRAPYPLLGGIPDVRAVPHAELARAFRRALSRHRSSESRRPAFGGSVDALAYGDVRGDASLRRALSSLLAQTRGVVAGEDGLLVTRGSQMALFLAARAMLAPGDVVAVESYGYRPAWEAFRLAGAELVPVVVDHEGLRVDALEKLTREKKVRAVYVTPHHQYPTTAMLPAARRLALLDLAKRARFAIIEDDYDHEFHYDGRPTLPLASADDGSRVVYIGTLSKILAPGLRVGFLVGPKAFLERAALLRAFVDRQGDLAIERAVAELIDDGVLARHTRKMRRLYKERRDVLARALEKHAPSWSFALPPGGLAIWVSVPAKTNVEVLADRAERRGVLVHTGRRFTFDGHAESKLRLGYAPLDPAKIREAVAILTSAS